MGREYEEERLFSENIDRLLAGEDVQAGTDASEDWRVALDFARKMTVLRAEPSHSFQVNLKASLLQKLSERESAARRGWFWRLIPQEPIWQTVAVLMVIFIVGGVLWGTLFRNPQPPMVHVPAPTITTIPSTSAPMTSTAPATTTAAPTTAGPTYLAASASTDKLTYQPGETVKIHMVWQNVTAQNLTIDEFPPILSIMDKATGQPVYTFTAGMNARTLAPGEKAEYDQTWDQLDFKGRQADPESYYLELEEMYYQGQPVPLKLANPVNFLIEPLPSGTDVFH